MYTGFYCEYYIFLKKGLTVVIKFVLIILCASYYHVFLLSCFLTPVTLCITLYHFYEQAVVLRG